MNRIRDLEREQPSGGDDGADVCVIGAGAAGIALTVELLRQGRRVLLLEAGGATIEGASQDPYRSTLAGLHHRGIHEGRFRTQGGSTTRWGGQILELDTEDFERRSHVEGSGWPFPKATLAPFYERALELEGLHGVLREDATVWSALGGSAPGLAGLNDYLSRWCPDPNFARVHGALLQSHPRLNVWLHANAVEMVLDGNHVTGVRTKTLTGRTALFQAKKYVFCLGGIESIRFFLQPREGGLPWNRSGLLGKHFQDHIDARGAEVIPLQPRRFHSIFDNIFLHGLKYQLKLRLPHQEQERLDTLNVAGNMIFVTKEQEAQDELKATARHLLKGRWSQVGIADLIRIMRHTPLVLRQAYRYKVQHRLYHPPDATAVLRIWCEQEPCGASSVSLSEERDGLGMLRSRLDWRISQREITTMSRYVEAVSRALAGMALVKPDLDLMHAQPEFVEHCTDCNHHMGGMRMSASVHDGVVDTNLQLYGTCNAYVCSSAVFPCSGYSNPTHTLLALSVRLADHLSSQ